MSHFFEFTRYKGSEVYVSPDIFTKLSVGLLPHSEDAFNEINSLIEDGSFLIGKANFGDESEDIIVMSNQLSILNPKKQ